MQSGSETASKVKNLYDTVGAIHESPLQVCKEFVLHHAVLPPPSRGRSTLRQGRRRGATMDYAAYRARNASVMRRAVSHTVPSSALTAMSAYFS